MAFDGGPRRLAWAFDFIGGRPLSVAQALDDLPERKLGNRARGTLMAQLPGHVTYPVYFSGSLTSPLTAKTSFFWPLPLTRPSRFCNSLVMLLIVSIGKSRSARSRIRISPT